MAENLSQIKLGAPRSIEGGEAPNASISVQVMEDCQSIALTDGSQPCTRQGAMAAGVALYQQWLAQVTEQASRLCSVEFASADDMMAYFGLGTGTMWQDGEVEHRVGGLRLRVADMDALATVLGDVAIEDVVDAEGYVKPEAVCFVGGEAMEGNALRGTADGCAVTGYGYGVLHARLWRKPDVLLSKLRVPLGVGAVTDSGEYGGESCPMGAQMKGSLTKLRELTVEELRVVYEVVAFCPAVAPMVAVRPELMEYQMVEYLESTGMQEINLNSTATTEFRWKLKVSTDTLNEEGCSIIGAYIDSYYGTHITVTQTTNECRSFDATLNKLYVGVESKRIIEMSYDYFNVNGHTITPLSHNNLRVPVTPIRLFRRGYNDQKAPIKLMWCNIFDNVSYILCPCYRRSDHKPGMIDLVSGQFFTNKGTGADFILGPESYDSLIEVLQY